MSGNQIHDNTVPGSGPNTKQDTSLHGMGWDGMGWDGVGG